MRATLHIREPQFQQAPVIVEVYEGIVQIKFDTNNQELHDLLGKTKLGKPDICDPPNTVVLFIKDVIEIGKQLECLSKYEKEE